MPDVSFDEKNFRGVEFREAKIASVDPEGKEWDVTIIGADSPEDLVTVDDREFLRSKNGRLYPTEMLKESTPLWDRIPVYDNHLTNEQFVKKQGMRSPTTEWLGTIINPVWNASTKQIRGVFKVVENALATKLKNAYDAGVLSAIGLSIDTFQDRGQDITVDGVLMPVVEGFKKILSVDLVGDPAAGGGFNRILAADITQNIQEAKTEMEEKEIKQMIDDAFGQVEDVVKTAMDEALAAKAEQEEVSDEQPETEPVEDEQPADEETEDDEESQQDDIQESVKRLDCRFMLRDKLDEAKLDTAHRDLVNGLFTGKVFKETELVKAIKSAKEAQANSDTTGRVTEASGQRGRVEGGLSPEEKAEIEFMRLVMGTSTFKALEHNEEDFVKDRIKEGRAYKSWVNAGKPNSGNYRRVGDLVYDLYGFDPLLDNRALEASTTTTLSTIVKNTVNIWTAADYSLQHRWYENVVTVEEVETIDTSTLARLYGTAELSVVNEGAAYTELGLEDEEETATFVKRGNYIGITLETMMRDKLNYVRTIPRRLSDTWFNTLSSQTAAVFTTNTNAGPVLADSGALFNATAAATPGGHVNLLTTALSFTGYSAARTAMRKQTNRPLGVGRRIQINPRYLLVPEDLETTALQIRNSPNQPGSANESTNPFFQAFDVIVVPDWTDTNNWALVGDTGRFPAIWHIFPRGNRTPQLFTADNEAAGAMFTNDTMRFKVRMMTYEFSSTYRVSPVSDFRPLHKSNVA